MLAFYPQAAQSQHLTDDSIIMIYISHCRKRPGNWSFDGPIPEREAAEPFYFRLLPNLASGMISSLANYRPFFSPFRHIPRSGGFCQGSNISMHKIIMAVTVVKRLFAQNSGPERSEMEVRAFGSIKKVTWDKLLASKVEIIHK